jgi:hypothetical protein
LSTFVKINHVCLCNDEDLNKVSYIYVSPPIRVGGIKWELVRRIHGSFWQIQVKNVAPVTSLTMDGYKAKLTVLLHLSANIKTIAFSLFWFLRRQKDKRQIIEKEWGVTRVKQWQLSWIVSHKGKKGQCIFDGYYFPNNSQSP